MGGPFDCIVATDTVFAKRLIDPLLRSIHALCACARAPPPPRAGTGTDADTDEADGSASSGSGGTGTAVWLCWQQRCEVAHAELLRQLPELFHVEHVPLWHDGDGEDGAPAQRQRRRRPIHEELRFAADLDCLLLRLTARAVPPGEAELARERAKISSL